MRQKRPLEDDEEKVELPATELLEEKEEEKPPAVETSDMEVDSVWVSSQFPAVTAALIAEIMHGEDEPQPPRHQAKVIRRVRSFGEKKKRNAPRRHQTVPEAHRVTRNAIGIATHVHAYVPNDNLRIGATFHAPWINLEDPERRVFVDAQRAVQMEPELIRGGEDIGHYERGPDAGAGEMQLLTTRTGKWQRFPTPRPSHHSPTNQNHEKAMTYSMARHQVKQQMEARRVDR